MRSVVVMFFVLSVLGGCAHSRVGKIKDVDSTFVNVKERIEFRPDSVPLNLPDIRLSQTVKCDSSRLENDYAFSVAKIMPDGQLFHSLSTKPRLIWQPIMSPVIRRDSVVYRNIYRTIYEEVEKELNLWQKIQMRGFWVILLLFALLIAMRKIIRLF